MLYLSSPGLLLGDWWVDPICGNPGSPFQVVLFVGVELNETDFSSVRNGWCYCAPENSQSS